jgi:hypothetical protein
MAVDAATVLALLQLCAGAALRAWCDAVTNRAIPPGESYDAILWHMAFVRIADAAALCRVIVTGPDWCAPEVNHESADVNAAELLARQAIIEDEPLHDVKKVERSQQGVLRAADSVSDTGVLARSRSRLAGALSAVAVLCLQTALTSALVMASFVAVPLMMFKGALFLCLLPAVLTYHMVAIPCRFAISVQRKLMGIAWAVAAAGLSSAVRTARTLPGAMTLQHTSAVLEWR